MVTTPATPPITIAPLAMEAAAAPLDRTAPLPPRLRPNATLSILDATKYFGDKTGGVRTYLLEKARHVAGHEALRHVLIAPGARDSIAEIDGVRCYRLRNRRIPTQAPYRFLMSASMIRRIVEHEQPDVIEVGSPFAVPWILRHANRMHRTPMVWFSHSNLPRMAAAARGVPTAIAEGLARGYTRRVSRLVHATIVGSAATARDFGSYGVSPVLTVPLGVDTTVFHPERRVRRADTRRAAGLPAQPLGIFVGRLAREKHLEVLLDAWADVEARAGARLLIVGDGPSRTRYRRHAYGDRVLWRTFEPDRLALADLVASADLFVTPSPTETFGLAALEALASGLPVLAPDSGAAGELVSCARAGATFATGDSGDLARTAAALLAGDRAELGARGRRYAEQHHAWSIVFERLFDAYRDIAARR